MYEMGWQRVSPTVGRLITDLESEFDLLRLERYMADLERRDERLVEEIDALKARMDPPTGATPLGYSALRDVGRTRRWWRALVTEGKVLWLEARRKALAEEWRRCSAIVDDIRFGLHLTGVRSPRE